jgi:hypothetical protein
MSNAGGIKIPDFKIYYQAPPKKEKKHGIGTKTHRKINGSD